MSNRSLIEINHDMSAAIRSNPTAFVEMLLQYLASASSRNSMAMREFGVKAISMRHHSENFVVSKDTEGFPIELPFDERKAACEERASRDWLNPIG